MNPIAVTGRTTIHGNTLDRVQRMTLRSGETVILDIKACDHGCCAGSGEIIERGEGSDSPPRASMLTQ
jgi:hypothetical protein